MYDNRTVDATRYKSCYIHMFFVIPHKNKNFMEKNEYETRIKNVRKCKVSKNIKPFPYTPKTMLASTFILRHISRASCKVGSQRPLKMSLILEELTPNNSASLA